MKSTKQEIGVIGKLFVTLGLIAPLENKKGFEETGENTETNRGIKTNKRVVGLIGKTLIALGLIVHLEDKGDTTETKEAGYVFNSYEEFYSKYRSVELLTFKKQEYAFCELKADQITNPQILSEIIRVVKENGKIRIEPIEYEIKPQLLEARLIKQINAMR